VLVLLLLAFYGAIVMEAESAGASCVADGPSPRATAANVGESDTRGAPAKPWSSSSASSPLRAE